MEFEIKRRGFLSSILVEHSERSSESLLWRWKTTPVSREEGVILTADQFAQLFRAAECRL